MECGICKQKMKKVRKDVSNNPNDNNKEYNRERYHCEKDDTWITIEMPNL
jgi:hypothetical protein